MNKYKINLCDDNVTIWLEINATKNEIKNLMVEWFEVERETGNYEDMYDFIHSKGYKTKQCDCLGDNYQIIDLPFLFKD